MTRRKATKHVYDMKLRETWYVQGLSQNIIEFLNIRSLRHLLEFSGSRLCRVFQDESKKRSNASIR